MPVITPTQIDSDAIAVLKILAEAPRAPRGSYLDCHDVARVSGLPPDRLNDAVALLVDSGYAEWIKTFGTAPYDFNSVIVTPRGRYEYQRLQATAEESPDVTDRTQSPTVAVTLSLPGTQGLGSPYGFTDEDWETVAERKHQPARLYTVLGHQFKSKVFDPGRLRENVEQMLQRAVARYNEARLGPTLTLQHRILSAGYGEHLFNEIARDIIGADIAVFETSDLNPNVMLEMGVALTWGVRVLPIKVAGKREPPSDVSGQTWADYRDSAANFIDPDHEQKLFRMIQRAIQKKGRGPV
jgi:hypothetical protein